jgi:ribosomal protein L11 methyltransferase
LDEAREPAVTGTSTRSFPALDVRASAPIDEALIEQWLAIVDEAGPTAVEAPGPGGSVRLFFNSSAHRDRARHLLEEADADLACAAVDVPDEAWAERSQAELEPVRVDRVVVTPPWRASALPTSTDDLVVVIQPSMGFGTGHHESTRLCLRLLQLLRIDGGCGLDVGTGSGVLAMAAVRLGATHVVAVDMDADAIDNARENIALNGLADAITLDTRDVTAAPLAERFDIITANLTGALLVRLAPILTSALRRNGHLIASGFTTDETSMITAALSDCGLTIDRVAQEHEWMAVLATLQN